jgi:hypothetical protein
MPSFALFCIILLALCDIKVYSLQYNNDLNQLEKLPEDIFQSIIVENLKDKEISTLSETSNYFKDKTSISLKYRKLKKHYIKVFGTEIWKKKYLELDFQQPVTLKVISMITEDISKVITIDKYDYDSSLNQSEIFVINPCSYALFTLNLHVIPRILFNREIIDISPFKEVIRDEVYRFLLRGWTRGYPDDLDGWAFLLNRVTTFLSDQSNHGSQLVHSTPKLSIDLLSKLIFEYTIEWKKRIIVWVETGRIHKFNLAFMAIIRYLMINVNSIEDRNLIKYQIITLIKEKPNFELDLSLIENIFYNL